MDLPIYAIIMNRNLIGDFQTFFSLSILINWIQCQTVTNKKNT